MHCFANRPFGYSLANTYIHILAAIEEIKSGNEPSLAAQVVDKTLQRVFYQSFFNRITAIRDQFESATSATLIQLLDETEAAFQAISGTTARSNEVLSSDRKFIEEGSNPGLDVQINESFARIRAILLKILQRLLLSVMSPEWH